MKTAYEIRVELHKLTDEFKNTNAFGQSVISQIMSKLCWVLDEDYNRFYLKYDLKDYSKERRPRQVQP